MLGMAGLVAAALALSIPSNADQARDGDNGPPPDLKSVLVPYESLGKLFQQGTPQIVIPFEEYEKLRNQARGEKEEKGPAFVLHSADYSASVAEGRFRFVADLRLTVNHTRGAEVPLFSPDEVALTRVKMTGARADTAVPVTVADNRYVLALKEHGTYELTVEGFVRPTYDRGMFSARFEIPRAGLARFDAEFPGEGVLPVLDPAWCPVTTPFDGGLQVTGLLSGRDAWDLKWKARSTTAAALTASTAEVVWLDEADLFAKYVVSFSTSGTFPPEITLLLPTDWEYRTAQGDGVTDWRVEPSSGTLALRLRMAPDADHAKFEAVVRRPYSTTADAVAIPPFRLPETRIADGFLLVVEPQFHKLRMTKAEGLASIPPARLPSSISAAGSGASFQMTNPEFRGVFTLEKIKPVFNAELATDLVVKEGIVNSTTRVDLTVTQGALGSVDILLPPEVTVDNVTGTVRRWTQQENTAGENRPTLHVELPSLVSGKAEIAVAMEIPYDTEGLAVPELRVEGAERERGTLGIVAEANVEIEPTDVENLTPIDPSELSTGIARSAARPAVAAFRYLEHPWSARLDIVKRDDVAVVTTVIEQAFVIGAVSENRRVLTELQLLVKNTVGQALALNLPAGASVWTCTVDGRAAKPAHDDEGRLLIPLVRATPVNCSVGIPIRLVYLVEPEEGTALSKTSVPLPRFDVPVNSMQVALQSPPGWTLEKIDGPFPLKENVMLDGLSNVSRARRDHRSLATAIEAYYVESDAYASFDLVPPNGQEAALVPEAQMSAFMGQEAAVAGAAKSSPEPQAPAFRYSTIEPTGRPQGTVGVIPLEIDLPPSGRRYGGLTTLLVPAAGGWTDSLAFTARLKEQKEPSAVWAAIGHYAPWVIVFALLLGLLLLVQSRIRHRKPLPA